MVYYRTPHPSPETATPVLSEIIAEAVHDAQTCQLNGRFFCAPASLARPASARPDPIDDDALLESELLGIARDYSFLYDADPEAIYAELRRHFCGESAAD